MTGVLVGVGEGPAAELTAVDWIVAAGEGVGLAIAGVGVATGVLVASGVSVGTGVRLGVGVDVGV